MAATGELVFAPLGGVGEIGMNLSLYGLGDERKRTWLIVDVGVSFASEENLPGIELVFPDIRHLIAERRNIAGIVLTHAHEDHYGAMLELWPKLRVPVFATPFTAALLAASAEQLQQTPEVGPVLAESVRSWLDEPRNRQLVDRLRDAGVRMEVPESERGPLRETGVLSGKTYVITGTLSSMSREQATAALEGLGAKVTSSVSKKTTAVFVGQDAGSKADKARDLGVAMLDENALLELLNS